jgi:hypothetical protein
VDCRPVCANPTVSAISRSVNRWRRANHPVVALGTCHDRTSPQPRANACRRCRQTCRVGRGSLRVGSGSFKHAICIALCPAELVVNGLPSTIGWPHNSQRSFEPLCCAVVSSAVGTDQLWVGPRRVRHSKPLILVSVCVAIAKPPSPKLHVCTRLNARQVPKLQDADPQGLPELRRRRACPKRSRRMAHPPRRSRAPTMVRRASSR